MTIKVSRGGVLFHRTNLFPTVTREARVWIDRLCLGLPCNEIFFVPASNKRENDFKLGPEFSNNWAKSGWGYCCYGVIATYW